MAPAKFVNGVNIDQLFATIEQVKSELKIAAFNFRAHNLWIDGTHNRATVKEFYGALQEDTTRAPITFEIDEPSVLCGNNLGANPVEYLLVALSGCLTTSLIAHAAAQGTSIRKVESSYDGDLDLRGFLGLSDDVPVGYQRINIRFKIDAELSEEQKAQLVEMA